MAPVQIPSQYINHYRGAWAARLKVLLTVLLVFFVVVVVGGGGGRAGF